MKSVRRHRQEEKRINYVQSDLTCTECREPVVRVKAPGHATRTLWVTCYHLFYKVGTEQKVNLKLLPDTWYLYQSKPKEIEVAIT